MKSTQTELRSRGKASKEEIAACMGLPAEELAKELHNPDPCRRTAAAYCLHPETEGAAELLLEQLCRETCLYTRIAVCESLEKGGRAAAEKMIPYLGRVGKNQHRSLPDKVSAKKSYPLPRDLIARTLAGMDPAVFPLLLDVLDTGGTWKISEALDAVGFMAFYHPSLVSEKNADRVIRLLKKESDEIIQWKALLCLSAFPVPEGIRVLKEFAGRTDLLGAEAARSLKLIDGRAKKEKQEEKSVPPASGWHIVPMTEEYAAEYLGWNYSAPYDFYNIPEENRQENMEEIKGAIDNWFAVADESGMLRGFYEFSFHEEQGEKVMEIGLGMRPEETGKGMGLRFVNAGISYARSFYHYERGTVVLLAADFNQRAIKTYERAGFVRYGERRAVSYGRPVTFVCMKQVR